MGLPLSFYAPVWHTWIALFLKPWWLYLIFGILFGVLAAMSVLTWRAKNATYKRYEGQKGSAEVAMSMLSKDWVKSRLPKHLGFWEKVLTSEASGDGPWLYGGSLTYADIVLFQVSIASYSLVFVSPTG